MNALAGPSWSWLSTPTNWTFPAKRLATDAIVGASAIQGPHHDAQTLTTTTRPRSWRSKSENDVRSNVGSADGELGRSDARGGADVAWLLPCPEHAAARRATAKIAVTARRLDRRIVIDLDS